MDYREALNNYGFNPNEDTYAVSKGGVDLFTITLRQPTEQDEALGQGAFILADSGDREGPWANRAIPAFAYGIEGFSFRRVNPPPKNQIIAVLDSEGLTEEVYEFGAMQAWSTMKSQMMTRREAWGKLQEFLQENPDFTSKVVYEAPQ